MVRVILADSERVRILVPRFQRFLANNNMAVVEQRHGDAAQLELVVNARLYGQAQCAEKLARGFFAQALLMVKKEFSPLPLA